MSDTELGNLPMTDLMDWAAPLDEALYVLQQAYTAEVLKSDALAAFVASQDSEPLEEALDALGQELSAHGYALYDVNTDSDGHNFVLLPATQRPALTGVYRFSDVEEAPARLCHRARLEWGQKTPRSPAPKIRLWDSVRDVGELTLIGDALATYWSGDTRSDVWSICANGTMRTSRSQPVTTSIAERIASR